MLEPFSKEDIFDEKARAVGFRGRWTSSGRLVNIWEIHGGVPPPIQEGASRLIELSHTDGFFTIHMLERRNGCWLLVAESPDGGQPIEESFLALEQQTPFPYLQLGALLVKVSEALAPLHALGLPSGAIGRAGMITSPKDASIRVDLTRALVPSTTVDWLSADTRSIIFQPQEVIRGCPSLTSDIYSLGMLIYLSLGGTSPFGEARGEDLLNRIVLDEKHLERPALDDGVQELWDNVVWALERSPEERNLDLGTLSNTAQRLQSKMRPYAVINRLIRRSEFDKARVRAETLIEGGLPVQEIIHLRELQFIALMTNHAEQSSSNAHQAVSYLQEGIRLCVDCGWRQQESQLRSKLAHFYLSHGMKTLAKKEMHRAAAGVPEDFVITLAYAKLLMVTGDADDGLLILRKMREAYPYNEDVVLTLIQALLNGKKNLSEAERICQESLASMKRNYQLLLFYAEICFRQSRHEEAIHILKDMDPKNKDTEVQNTLARIYMEMGDRENAQKHLVSSLRLKGGQHLVIDQLVDLLDKGAEIVWE